MMEKNEFIEKAREMMEALRGLGYPCHISHDRNATFFTFRSLRNRTEITVYNGKNGVIYCHNLDLSVRIKESDDFLEVVEG